MAQISGSVDGLPLVRVLLLLGSLSGVYCIGDMEPRFLLGHTTIMMKIMTVTQAMIITMETTAATMNSSRYDDVFGDAGISSGSVGVPIALVLLTGLARRLSSLALVAIEELP